MASRRSLLFLAVLLSAFSAISAGIAPEGPAIDVWYGDTQPFGYHGNPQEWVNVLGNVADPDGIASLSYSLNGSAGSPLSIGPDTRRLLNPGDFNIEISFTLLDDGLNQVTIDAMDGLGNPSQKTVTIDYDAGNVWPRTWTVDWSASSNIQDLVQIVDGRWNIEAGGVRPVDIGYDRNFVVGDLGWTDFEVTIPITIHAIDPSGFQFPSIAPGIGFTLRWAGHTEFVPGEQPFVYWMPQGAGPWYSYDESEGFQLWGGDGLAVSDPSRELEFNVLYYWKARVQTVSSGVSFYGAKIWRDGDLEPAEWDLSGTEGPPDLQSGSLIVLAHHVDATFGDIVIEELQPAEASVELTTPPPDTVLPGATVTFEWIDLEGDVTEWWLTGGSTSGQEDLINSGSLGSNLSYQASGLPVDGRPIFVRLWYRTNGPWEFVEYPYTAATASGGGTPEITQPVPDSVLAGSSATFEWIPNGAAVTEWWLIAGSTQGGDNLLNSGSLGTSLSYEASGLPTDGTTIHVRLWYALGATWLFEDFQYTAATIGGGGTPEITQPVPGSELPGPTVTFQWVANGTSVSEWWLTAGSVPGQEDLLNSGSLGTSLSYEVVGLPTDGRTIHVRLWYRVGASWLFQEFQYTAATIGGGGTPEITTPAPGSELPGSTVTFEWVSNGAAVSEWWITAGSVPGQEDLLNSGSLGTSLSWEATGLPTDGRTIHVRLWYRIAGVWLHGDFPFTAADLSTGDLPEITEPAPGSVLLGSTVDFAWVSNGTPVLEWWITAGSTPGQEDLLNSGSLGTALSYLAQGLPTDGRQVFVRLWYRLASGWAFSEFTFQAATQVQTGELIAHWTFDEGQGALVTDSSGNGHYGIINGATWVAGRPGSALHFNGGSVVEVLDQPDLRITGDITIAAWVRKTALSTTGVSMGVVSKSSATSWDYDLFFSSSNLEHPAFFSSAFGTGEVMSSAAIGLNAWHHVAVTRAGASAKIYIDGVQMGAATLGQAFGQSSNSLLIGHDLAGGFIGDIDEVLLYDRGLTAAEVRQIYHTGIPPE